MGRASGWVCAGWLIVALLGPAPAAATGLASPGTGPVLRLVASGTPPIEATLAGERWTGVVTRVSDGDTLWVRPDAPLPGGGRGQPVKLRLQGIDAPERCQAGGAAATEALSSRVLRQRVTVRSRALDDYQRTLGDVFIGDEDISAWMVAEGQAWSYRWRRSPGRYAAEEASARAAGKGLFADPSAIEPRVFRRQHGPCKN